MSGSTLHNEKLPTKVSIVKDTNIKKWRLKSIFQAQLIVNVQMCSFTNGQMLIAIPWQGQQWQLEINLIEMCVTMSCSVTKET